jgi:hypothetical protein
LAELRKDHPQGPEIKPGSPEAAKSIERLQNAARLDRLNANGYRGGEGNKAVTFYYEKADSAEALARKLKGGEPVAKSDVDKALDTSQAIGFE